jgi:hypothetical protein
MVAAVLSPGRTGWLALLLMMAMMIVGFIEQGVRLGDLTPRIRRLGVGLAIAAWLVLLVAKIECVIGDLSYLVIVAFALAAGAGFLVGAFIASLSSRQNSGGALLARANTLTDFTGPSVEQPPRATYAVPAGDDVEVFLDGKWQPATLTAWDTRDFALHACVRLTHQGDHRSEWVSADLVRRAGSDQES